MNRLLIALIFAILPTISWAQAIYNPGVYPSTPLVSGNEVIATGPNSVTNTGVVSAFGALPSASAASPTTTGTGYIPGELVTLTGGTFTRAAKMAVATTQVVSATVNAGGSGGTNGTQTVTGTTGTGTKFQASVTVSGGAITAVLSISVAGSYTVNPTDITQEPVTGASLSGAKLAVIMGVLQNLVADSGLYSVVPSSPVAQGSTSGVGTGATFTLTWAPWSPGVLGANLAGGGNLFLGGNSGAGSNFDLAGGVNAGVENTYIGDRAGGRATIGGFNTALGHNAFGIGAGTAVTGSNNVAVGADAMRNTTTSSNTVAVGENSLRVVTGDNNTAVGYNTLAALTSGGNNVAVGLTSGQAMTGSSNVFVGAGSASDGTGGNGSNNTAIGKNSGLGLTTGNNNTLLGSNVGVTLKTGASNILIGTSNAVDVASSSTASTLNIGNLLKGDLSKAHRSFGGSAPAVSACGTGSPTIDSTATDSSGRVTTGTVATTCTVTFAQAYGVYNHCVVTSQSAISGLAYSYTLSAITVTAAALGGDLIDYSCDGN